MRNAFPVAGLLLASSAFAQAPPPAAVETAPVERREMAPRA